MHLAQGAQEDLSGEGHVRERGGMGDLRESAPEKGRSSQGRYELGVGVAE